MSNFNTCTLFTGWALEMAPVAQHQTQICTWQHVEMSAGQTNFHQRPMSDVHCRAAKSIVFMWLVQHQAGRGGGSHARRPACKSCAIALDDWELQNSAAFGGRCENCEQLHKEGNFCPVCDKVCALLPALCRYCTLRRGDKLQQRIDRPSLFCALPMRLWH